jgi:hypothetical protein
MPVVAMPDGTQVSFPDEMPAEQIKGLIASKFPDAVKGKQPAAAEPAPDDHGLSERQKLTPLGKALNPITSYPDTYQQMNQEARDQISRGAGQLANPQGAMDVVKGAGNVAGGAIGFVASPINAAYRSVIGQPVEDVTGIPREYTEFAVQLATPGIGLAGKASGPTIAQAPAKALSPGQEVVAAADRLSQSGGPVNVPRAVATDSMPVQQAGAVTSNIPVAGTPLVKAAERTIDQLGTKSDEVAQGYGGASSVSQTGEAARSSIKDWITGQSADTATKLYGKVDDLINPDVKTPLAATQEAVAKIAAKRDAAALTRGKATDAVLDAVQRADGLTYEGVKTLRTNVGEMLNGGILPEGVSGSELKQIYGALSKDLETSVASAGGPQASAAFERANRYYGLASERRESLAKIIGSDGNAPAETVFGRLEAMAGSTSRADVSKLAQARKAMGSEDWNEVTSTVVTRLGRDPEGNFSPQRFVTAYGKLSDAGKQILFRSSDKSDLAQHLDDIAKVSSRFKELQKFANPSGTARAGIGAFIGTGAFTEPLSTISSVLGGRAVATALARPASAASIAKLAKSQEALVVNPSPSKAAAYGLAARNLISTLGAKNITPADFIRSLARPHAKSRSGRTAVARKGSQPEANTTSHPDQQGRPQGRLFL